MTALLPTAFHARTAEHNLANAWVRRGAFTVPAHYGEAQQEALAARVSAVLIDLSPREDLRVHGPGAGALLSAALGTDMDALEIGTSRRVHWCADGGGLRGIGTIGRFGETNFLLRSQDADLGWFAEAAPRFGATLRDETKERGVLLLAGPYAFAVLAAAGLEAAVHLDHERHGIFDWRGIGVTVSRRGPRAAYQISCAAEDGTMVFDRLWRAGRMFGLRLAGQDAFELLLLEAGRLLAGVDFMPAREHFARMPTPSSLGLSDMKRLNGQAMGVSLAGLEFDADEPAPFSPVFHNGGEIGRTLRSAYSPALRRAIALASVDPARAATGTIVHVRSAGPVVARDIPARIVTLPFLA